MLPRHIDINQPLPKEDFPLFSKAFEQIKIIKEKIGKFLRPTQKHWSDKMDYTLIVSKGQSTSQLWHIDFGSSKFI